jgi:hypothetical protein
MLVSQHIVLVEILAVEKYWRSFISRNVTGLNSRKYEEQSRAFINEYVIIEL